MRTREFWQVVRSVPFALRGSARRDAYTRVVVAGQLQSGTGSILSQC